MARSKVTGLLPGAECPSCKKGYLKAVITVDRGSRGPRGPGAFIWERDVIERLGCSNCSQSFETALRHKTLYQIFERQLKKLRRDPNLKACPDHPDLKLKSRGHWPDEGYSRDIRSSEDVSIKHCPACLRICKKQD